ncbi:hypothetical protein TNCV_4282061 [Trichonephila clavipes]|nr:hypothetical protein TNCV_4282061 [Trichonephila clavipes]
MKMRVVNQSRPNDRLRVMLVQVHIAITPPHAPLPVFWRIGEQTMPYSWPEERVRGRECRVGGPIPSTENTLSSSRTSVRHLSNAKHQTIT